MTGTHVDGQTPTRFDQRWNDILSRQPTVGLAVGLVRDGQPTQFRSTGVADIETGTPIGEDTVFRIASITKTFTAVAVMQLWEQGLVDLDAPVNDYLRALRLVPADHAWRPATVRHLLTHTAGLPEVSSVGGILAPDFGESVEVGDELPSLEAFYGGALRLRAEPGTRFVYNNHGPATLGQLVADVSGLPLDRYFRERIFEPLGMADTDLNRTERVRQRLATGYEIGGRGVRKVEERDMVTAGAASIFSTPKDMARYVAALLAGGNNDGGSILHRDTLAVMFEPHFRPDPRIPGMGLGFFRRELAGHAAVHHQGSHPGFHSEICLVPEAGVGAMAFTNGAHRADLWLPSGVSAMIRTVVGTETGTVAPVRRRPERWSQLTGWYGLSASFTDVRLRGMIGLGIEVFVKGGRLMCRFLTPVPELARGFVLHEESPTDPFVFRIDLAEADLEPIRAAFGVASSGVVDRLYLDVMPLTLRRRPDALNPRRWAGWLLGMGGVGLALRLRCHPCR